MENTATDRRRARRIARADETRRKALSPLRIAFQVCGIPLVACAVTVSVYIRTSDYPPTDAMRHLFALAGCDWAEAVGLAPAAEGRLGYHKRNDPDGDGIACAEGLAHWAPNLVAPVAVDTGPSDTAAAETPDAAAGELTRQMSGGAKFVRP